MGESEGHVIGWQHQSEKRRKNSFHSKEEEKRDDRQMQHVMLNYGNNCEVWIPIFNILGKNIGISVSRIEVYL